MSDCLPQRKSRATTSDYFDLPQELLLEILVRLPIKDVVKSTAVCKSWNSVIKNPTFISTHLEKTISSTNTRLLLFRICSQKNPHSFKSDPVEQYSLRFDNEGVDEYKQLHFPINKFKSAIGCFRVAGSINGLVCLVDDVSYVHNFYLWNPIIKKAVHVPTAVHVPRRYHNQKVLIDAFVGFGFDSKMNDYKLLRYVELNDTYPRKEPKVEVEIYSLNANCWRSITHTAPKYDVIFNLPSAYANSFVNGAIHLLACDRKDGRNRNLILAFDMSEEVFRDIPLPDCWSKNDPVEQKMWSHRKLLKYGQSIAAVTWEGDDWGRNEIVTLWVMKEYGVAMSWTKILTEAGERVPRVLFFRKDEEVFLTIKDGWIASLDIKNQHSVVFVVHSYESRIVYYPVVDSFVESLVLLDKGNASWDVILTHEDPSAEDEKGAPRDDASSVDIIQIKKELARKSWLLERIGK
ncbi:hypothetical protein COLO4_09165 [Corchorus olitorius]|uniref:F-box domain-containing protein n=1 Tax=Corchorus olitorius TaxID=93759 RepID=A0A1R3KD50_9ROSI|nr:hypothetical protein COLO4_09165 [Corchorus olitorius]